MTEGVLKQPVWNFEQEPWTEEDPDESSVNLRAYFDRMRDEKFQQYRPEWSDEQIIEWDGNFTSDGNLMLGCSEREIEIDEYRRVMALCVAYRNRVRGGLTR